MMGLLSKLRRSEDGLSVVEFGLVAPAFLAMVLGIANMGIFFFAHSGLKSAVAEGARFASISPKPSNDAIAARITERRFGLNPSDITLGPTVTDCTVADGSTRGRPCVDIEMRYQVKMNWIVVGSGSWTVFNLTERRRAFVYPNSLSSS